MNLKKIIVITIVALILGLSAFGVYTYFYVEDKESTLTMAEKQWIEDNKNNMIDLGIVNNIPIFNYNGEGVFFDFISSIEENTNLEFNKLSFNYGKNKITPYSFSVVDEVGENDLLIYQDNYAILSNKEIKYNSLEEISIMTIGVLQSDMENVSNFLGSNSNISFKTFEDIDAMLNALTAEEIKQVNNKNDKNSNSKVEEVKKIDAIALPKTVYLSETFENDLLINYNITEISKNIVLTLGESKKLNDIIKKYYEKWKNEEYEKSYNNHFTQYYFDSNNIDDDAKVKFKSKQYKYGFIDYAPYDSIADGRLTGLNPELLASFSKVADIEIKYQSEYKSAEDLISAFNSNKVDIYLNNYSNEAYEIDVASTISSFDEEIVVLAKQGTNYVVNSIKSLNKYNVSTLKNSKISSELLSKNINVKEYNNVGSLLEHLNNSIVVIDRVTYESYKTTYFSGYNEIYNYRLGSNYSYNIRNIEDNKVFINFFNFYLSFINEQEYYNKIDYSIFNKAKNNQLMYIIIAVIIVLMVITILFMNKDKYKNKKMVTVSKDSKLKYIDMLTSLKNRNYLNDQIEKWDESEVYPQTIIIVDLNNVAYINDNYGHTEGDNVIKEAANILFKNQIENSEIMRTNGNEFLIYLVEYDEKQVISYIRKLNKELKDLSHGFGAAIGYSMITDGLKTVDDAINEATLDMKSNKEEANN